MNVPITPEIATCLLTTIMTDTGGFMHSNTTADVLRISAELIELGADQRADHERDLRQQALRGAPAARRGDVLARSSATDGRYCWSVVDEAMLARNGADGEDTEEIVQHLRAVEGVDAAALFKAYDGDVRVSLRSNGKINVQAAAARLGGGGHFRAAGLTYAGPVEQAIEAVRAALHAEGL